MSLAENGGLVDAHFNILAMCETFGWTYQDYLHRPLWFDAYYAIKLKAEAKYQEIQSSKHE